QESKDRLAPPLLHPANRCPTDLDPSRSDGVFPRIWLGLQLDVHRSSPIISRSLLDRSILDSARTDCRQSCNIEGGLAHLKHVRPPTKRTMSAIGIVC